MSDEPIEIGAILKDVKDTLNSIDSKLDMVINNQSTKNSVLTDRELYELKDKEGLSWSQLSKRTGISVSTLQSRVRRYRDSILSE